MLDVKELNEERKSQRVSCSTIAKLVGCATNTVNAILTGKYCAPMSRLALDVQYTTDGYLHPEKYDA